MAVREIANHQQGTDQCEYWSTTPKQRATAKLSRPPSAGPNWPFIVQLAWAVIDLRIDRVVQQVGVVRLPKGVLVEPEAAEIHGSRRNDAINRAELPGCLGSILGSRQEYRFCVCHNVGFDCPVVMSNLMRCQGYHDLYCRPYGSRILRRHSHVCTMVECRSVQDPDPDGSL